MTTYTLPYSLLINSMDLFNLHDGVSVVVGAQEQTPLILVPVEFSHLSLSCQGRIG
jgi:hypothetical protein